MEDGQTIGDSSFCFLSLIVFVQKQPRSDAAGVALGGKVYVVGGFDGANQLRSVERFNPRTGRWKKVAFLLPIWKRRVVQEGEEWSSQERNSCLEAAQGRIETSQ